MDRIGLTHGKSQRAAEDGILAEKAGKEGDAG